MRGQLGERLLGAVKLAADALGVTTQELNNMLQRGEVLAKDLLPAMTKNISKMAREGGALEEQLKSLQTAQGQFNLLVEESSNKIFESGFETGLRNFYQQLTKSLEENEQALIDLGRIYRVVFNGLAFGAKVITPILDVVLNIFGGISEVIEDLASNKIVLFSAAIIALVSNFRKLAKFLTPFRATLLGVLLLLDEIHALFKKGRVGVIEMAIGDQDLSTSSKGLTSSVGGLLEKIGITDPLIKFGTQVALIVGAFMLLKKAIIALTTAVWANTAMRMGKGAGKLTSAFRKGKPVKAPSKTTASAMDDVLRRTKGGKGASLLKGAKGLASGALRLSPIAAGLGALAPIDIADSTLTEMDKSRLRLMTPDIKNQGTPINGNMNGTFDVKVEVTGQTGTEAAKEVKTFIERELSEIFINNAMAGEG